MNISGFRLLTRRALASVRSCMIWVGVVVVIFTWGKQNQILHRRLRTIIYVGVMVTSAQKWGCYSGQLWKMGRGMHFEDEGRLFGTTPLGMAPSLTGHNQCKLIYLCKAGHCLIEKCQYREYKLCIFNFINYNLCN